MLKFRTKSNKGASEVMWLAIVLAGLVLFYFIYSGGFSKLFGRTVKSANEQISLTGDRDKDNILNLEDKCPCLPGTFDAPYKGCPIDKQPTDDEKKCPLT